MFIVFMLSDILCLLYLFTWCPTRFPYQMMFMSFFSNTAGVICGTGTVNPVRVVYE